MRTRTLILINLFIISSLDAQDFGWVKQIGASDSQIPEDIAFDYNGNVITCGWFRGTVDFNPGPGIFNYICNPDIGDELNEDDAFISKLDSAGNFVWAKKFSGPGIQVAKSLTCDVAGNIYITGHFSGIVDFDPGPGIFLLEAAYFELFDETSWTIFTVKLDNDGNFLWAFSVGSGSLVGQSAEKIVVDELGNAYLSGRFGESADFDPGPGIEILECSGIYDAFVAKYDANGNYVWAKRFGGLGDELSYSLDIDTDNNVITSGHFYGTVDFDPGPGEYFLENDGLWVELFISKLDENGNFVWANQLQGSNSARSEAIITDHNSNIILFSNYQDTIDADPGADETQFISAGGEDILMSKYAPDGSFLWAHSFGDITTDKPLDAYIDYANNIFVTGYFQGTVDFDPGPGVFNLIAEVFDIFIAKYDADGNFIYALQLGGDGDDVGSGIAIDLVGNIYATGSFDGTADFDPGAGLQTLSCIYDDIFILKLTQNYCAGLAIVIDSLGFSDCDGTAGLVSGHAVNGIAPYNYFWNTDPPTFDSVAVFESGGFHTITISDSLGCVKSSNLLMDGPLSTTGYDLKAYLVTTDLINGFENSIWLDAYNDGCEAADGFVEIVLDPDFEYGGAIPAPDLIDGDTLRWNFTDNVYGSEHITAQIFLTPDGSLGDILCNKVFIKPSVDDVFPLNNSKIYCNEITGSYDPNDKQVYPLGICDPGYILNTDTLTYTIRFQNTGTSEAVNIFILDTLSDKLNLNTLNIASASHAMTTELLDGNIIKFLFSNINLPDSNSNEAESHGYVIFDILPIPDLADGSEILNTSSIYFDFNDPVFTNTVTNTVLESLPASEFTQTFSLCTGEQIEVGDNLYDSPGIYHDTLSSLFGCDSILTTIISAVYTPDEISNSIFICEGESIEVGDNIYTDAGTYIDIFSNIHGCDSIITTNLFLFPAFNEIIDATICTGEFYTFADTVYSAAGTYLHTFNTINGCDSVVELELSIDMIDISITQTISSLTANISGADYQWIDCNNDNLPIEGAVGQIFTPAITGNYAVVISKNDCVDTSECYFIDVVNLEDSYSVKEIQLFPNPAGDIMNLKFNNSKPGISLEIFSITGISILKEVTTKSNEIKINTSAFSPGVYMIEIKNGGDIKRIEFVKN